MAKNTLTVALSLDFDAHSGLKDAGYDSQTDFSRGAYGPLVGVGRIIQAFQRLDVPLSTFIPGTVAERFPDACKALRDAGFTIGHHGYTHTGLANMKEAEEREQLERGIEAIEKHTGVHPIGYRAPWLQISDRTHALLTEYDFLYDASECGFDHPYTVPLGQKQLVEIPGKLILIDTPLFMNFAANGYPPTPTTVETVETIWRDEFLAMYHCDEDLYLSHTIHPFCIGHLSRINMYERFVRFMQSHDGVTFLTMEQIASQHLKA